jgi:hypothetical protein
MEKIVGSKHFCNGFDLIMMDLIESPQLTSEYFSFCFLYFYFLGTKMNLTN